MRWRGTRRAPAGVGAFLLVVAAVLSVVGTGTGAAATAPKQVGAAAPASGPLDLTVSRFADDHSPGSLREAVDEANTGSYDSVTIHLPAGSYDLAVCGTAGVDENANQSGDLDYTNTATLTIVAEGGDATIAQTCAGQRILDQRSFWRVTLQGLTLTGGQATGGPARGGAVRSFGAVALTNVHLHDNTATAAAGGDAQGGAVYTAGSLDATDTTLEANHAIGAATADLTHGAARGGAVAALGPVTLTRTTLHANDATGPTTALAPNLSNADLTIANGSAAGGAVWAPNADVTITDSTITQNAANAGPGLLVSPWWYEGNTSGAWARGGAVDTGGAVHISGSTFDANAATGGADSAFAGAGPAFGGAVAASGDLDASSSTFTDNRATGAEGYFFVDHWFTTYGEPGGKASGGAVSSASATLTDVTATANSAEGGSGDAYAIAAGDGGFLRATGAVTVTRGDFGTNTATGSGGAIDAATQVDTSGATFHGNTARVAGGAIAGTSAVVTATSFVQNTGTAGGALSVVASAAVTDSTFSANQAGATWTDIYGSAPPGKGGAIAAGDTTIARTTIRGNAVVAPPWSVACDAFRCYQYESSDGGGVWVSGSVTVTDSTVAENTITRPTSLSPGRGAAVHAGTAINATNSTIIGNRAVLADYYAGLPPPDEPSPGAAVAAPQIALTAVTLATNDGTSAIEADTLTVGQSLLVLQANGPLCGTIPSVVSLGANWTDDASCGLADPTDTTSAAPVFLAALADNGGPSPTALPTPYSPVVDHVATGACTVVADQRGTARPAGLACDVGATEQAGVANSPVDVGITVTAPATAFAGTTQDYTVTVTSNGRTSAPAVVVDLPPGGSLAGTIDAPAGASCQPLGTTQVTCWFAAGIPDGTAQTVTIPTALPVLPGALTVTVHAYADGPDGDSTNNDATATTEATSVANVGVALRPFAAAVIPGGTAWVVADLQIGGVSPVAGTADHPVVVSFDLPPGMRATGSSLPTGWVCGTGTSTVACTFVGTLRASSPTLYLDVAFDATMTPTPAVHTVTATVTAGVTTDTDPTDDVAALAFQLLPVADLAVQQASITPDLPASTIAFTMTNAGGSPAESPSVSVSLPAASTFADWSVPGFTCTAATTSTTTLTCTGSSPLAVGASIPVLIHASIVATPGSAAVVHVSSATTDRLASGDNWWQTALDPPGSPTDLAAVPDGGGTSAVVSWTAPATSGTAPITAYTVVAEPSGSSCTWTSGPLTCMLTGLPPLSRQTITVTATSAYGPSTPATLTFDTGPQADLSIDSLTVVGGAPSTLSFTALDHGPDAADATITVALPLASTIQGWDVPGFACTTSSGSDLVLTCQSTAPLAVDVPVPAQVSADIRVGPGGGDVTVRVDPQSVDADTANDVATTTLLPPGAPASASATLTGHVVDVTWPGPAQPGSAPIDHYTVRAVPTGETCTATAPTRSCSFASLTPGNTYTFAVVATNAFGDSPSVSSGAVAIPWSTDLAVAAPTLTAGTDALVAFTVTNHGPLAARTPTITLTLPLTSTFVTTAVDGFGCTTSTTVTGFADNVLTCTSATPLDVDASVQVQVHANVSLVPAGQGSLIATATSSDDDANPADNKATTTVSTPSVPQNVRATVGPSTTSVDWDPPADTGSGPVIRYDVLVTPGLGRCQVTTGSRHCVFAGVNDGNPHIFSVRAFTILGRSNDASATTNGTWAGAGFHPVAPVRLLDSRTTNGAWNGPLASGAPRTLTITPRPDSPVPATATAVVVNLTVTSSTAASFLTAWPAGTAKPTTSLLNFAPGETAANAATLRLGANGSLSFATAIGATHVVVDLLGYYDDGTGAGDRYNPLAPTRVLDSRTAVGGWAMTPLTAGTTRSVAVRQPASPSGVPATATSVVANLTVTNSTAGSFVSVWPGGQSPPGTSSINFAGGQTRANLVTVPIGANGALDLATAVGSVDVVVDVVGYYDSTGGLRFVPIDPTRQLDDRIGVGLTGAWGPHQTRTLTVTGGVVPSSAVAIAANLTATNGSAGSFASVTPAGVITTTSSLNFGPGQTIPNHLITALDASGRIDLRNELGTVDLVLDTYGYFR